MNDGFNAIGIGNFGNPCGQFRLQCVKPLAATFCKNADGIDNSITAFNDAGERIIIKGRPAGD